MPNHCSCELRITGPIGDLLRFKDGLKENPDGGSVSFINSYLPMPDDIRRSQSPTKIVETEQEVQDYHEKNRKFYKDPDRIMDGPITKETQKKLRAKYGVDNWYDWAIKHYGTKWGDYHTEVSLNKKTLRIDFDSAWSPPIVAIESIALQFPSLTFDLKYWEGGAGFKGQYRIKGDETLIETQTSYRGSRGG